MLKVQCSFADSSGWLLVNTQLVSFSFPYCTLILWKLEYTNMQVAKFSYYIADGDIGTQTKFYLSIGYFLDASYMHSYTCQI